MKGNLEGKNKYIILAQYVKAAPMGENVPAAHGSTKHISNPDVKIWELCHGTGTVVDTGWCQDHTKF